MQQRRGVELRSGLGLLLTLKAPLNVTEVNNALRLSSTCADENFSSHVHESLDRLLVSVSDPKKIVRRPSEYSRTCVDFDGQPRPPQGDGIYSSDYTVVNAIYSRPGVDPIEHIEYD